MLCRDCEREVRVELVEHDDVTGLAWLAEVSPVSEFGPDMADPPTFGATLRASCSCGYVDLRTAARLSAWTTAPDGWRGDS